jgi:hypothetical protein
MPPILQKSLFFIWNKIPKDGIRHCFQWNYSGVFIPFFWGAVLAWIGIASAIENSRPVFIMAYIFALAGWIWTLGYWITCDYLHKKNPNTWERARKKRTSKRGWIVYQIWRYSVSF